MNILNRDFASYLRNIPRIPDYIWYVLKCFILFKKPLRFLYAYLTITPLAERMVELRSGLKIILSEHPHDIITIFVVFVRKDYGDMPANGVVIDIGANIGVFSLYAAHIGKVSKVFAYEPNSESFHYLLENISTNYLEQIIVPHRLAVTGMGKGIVKFPKKSSMYNAIIESESDIDFEEVETTSMPMMFSDIENINLLKLDCEGAEYAILMESDQDVFKKISAIRMEYHFGREDEISTFLKQFGFIRCHFHQDSEKTGNLWYHKQD
jgi:FkbM family methyltransferase